MKTQGSIIWSTLNKSIKNCSSLAIFKNKLKKHILDKYKSELINSEYASIESILYVSFIRCLSCTLISMFNPSV